MNIAEIQVPEAEAATRLKQIRNTMASSAFSRANQETKEEYRILKNLYNKLVKNERVINVHQAIIHGGSFPGTWLPKLAIARSSARYVEFSILDWARAFRFYVGNEWRNFSAKTTPLNIVVPVPRSLLPPDSVPNHDRTRSGRTHIPAAPLEVLGEKKSENCFTLFEVEAWERSRVHADPYLLRHLGGPFYQVIGEWDVTPLEAELKQFMIQKR